MPELINNASSISWQRAHQFGRMLACHLHNGRFEYAMRTIDWARRESQEVPEPFTLRSPIAALRLPIWIVDKLNELDLVYVHQLIEIRPSEILSWRTENGRCVGRRAFDIICRKLTQKGIRIWKQQPHA